MCSIFLHWIPANFAHSLSFLINIFSFSFFLVNLCLCLLQSDSCHPQDLQASSSITQMQPIMDPEVSKMREGEGGREEGGRALQLQSHSQCVDFDKERWV